MSIIDSVGNSVVKFDSKTSKAFSGQRLSKVLYKKITDKENPMFGIQRDSMCVSVPMIAGHEVEKNIKVLIPHVVEFLQGVQDKVIKELVESGQKSIMNVDIGIDKLVDWLESNNESGRITKEVVGDWFDKNVSDTLAVVLAEKLGVSEVPSQAESDQIMKAVGVFRDKVSGLAGGKTMYEIKVAESLKKVINFAEDGDVLKARFVARLDKIIEEGKKEVSMIDLL